MLLASRNHVTISTSLFDWSTTACDSGDKPQSPSGHSRGLSGADLRCCGGLWTMCWRAAPGAPPQKNPARMCSRISRTSKKSSLRPKAGTLSRSAVTTSHEAHPENQSRCNRGLPPARAAEDSCKTSRKRCVTEKWARQKRAQWAVVMEVRGELRACSASTGNGCNHALLRIRGIRVYACTRGPF